MEAGAQIAQRAGNYYDRDLTERSGLTGANPGAAAEGSTTTASRTVPSGTRGFLQFAGVWVENHGTAATNASAQIGITITTAAAASSRAALARLPTGSAAARIEMKSVAGLGALPAGASVAINRISNNTAANSDVEYEGTYHMVEFAQVVS